MSIRSVARARVLDILGLLREPAKGVHILNGHMMNHGAYNNISNEQFTKLLKQLAQYVKFIPIEEAVKKIEDGERPSRPEVAFTFDDGFMDCYYGIAPILESFGINGAFFINPNFVEGDREYINNFTRNIVMTPDKKPMRWEQIMELSQRGHVIGAHTLDHYMINDGSSEVLRHQIVDCRKVIEDKLQKECDWFAFPYGRLEHANPKAIEISCETYKYVFSQSDYKNYYSFNGRVINRRHFEPFWPIAHLKFFLSCNKK